MKKVLVLAVLCFLLAGCDSKVDDLQNETIAYNRTGLIELERQVITLLSENASLREELKRLDIKFSWKVELLSYERDERQSAEQEVDAISLCTASQRDDPYRPGESSLTQDQLKPKGRPNGHER